MLRPSDRFAVAKLAAKIIQANCASRSSSASGRRMSEDFKAVYKAIEEVVTES